MTATYSLHLLLQLTFDLSLIVVFLRRRPTWLEHTLDTNHISKPTTNIRGRTSVISNFTLPIASPSAMARKEVNMGCPTTEDNVSRCWCASHSLETSSINTCTGICDLCALLTILTNRRALHFHQSDSTSGIKGTPHQYQCTAHALFIPCVSSTHN